LPAVENILRNDLAAVIARAIDLAALTGSGSSNQPLGIQGQSNVNGPIDMSPSTWAGVLSFISNVQADNADFGNLGWALHPNAVAKLRQTVVVGSTDSRMIMADPDSLAGYPVATTTALQFAGSPTVTRMFFGSWSQLLVGYWSGLDVLLNPFDSTAFPKGRVVIRAMRDVDIAVRHGEAFCFSTDMAN
jgi:HK97 family phage major capsid protein